MRAKPTSSHWDASLTVTGYIRLSFAMPPKLLEDVHASRIQGEFRAARDVPALRRWLEDLLNDREARVAIELKLARQIHHLRKRLTQASKYLDGLANDAQSTASYAWKTQQPCKLCGAPSIRNRTELRPGGGHVSVVDHPDGKTCREP